MYNLSERKILFSHDVSFNEATFPFSEKGHQPIPQSFRVRTHILEDEDETLDLIDEAVPHTDQNVPDDGLKGMVDELTTHTDTSPPDQSQLEPV